MEHIGSLSYADLSIIAHFIKIQKKKKKNTYVNITTILIRKIHDFKLLVSSSQWCL